MTAPTIIPPRSEANHFADEIFDFLFPTNRQQLHEASTRCGELAEYLKRLLAPLAVDANHVADAFFAALPTLYNKLLEDANATMDFDPAATSLEEVIFTYPGFYAIAIYRMAHELTP